MKPMPLTIRRLAPILMALATILSLAACAGAVAPGSPVGAGGYGTLARTDSWGFGARSPNPGFLVDRGGSGGA